ncbi:unnamed protein product [Laminaria digitata]
MPVLPQSAKAILVRSNSKHFEKRGPRRNSRQKSLITHRRVLLLYWTCRTPLRERLPYAATLVCARGLRRQSWQSVLKAADNRNEKRSRLALPPPSHHDHTDPKYPQPPVSLSQHSEVWVNACSLLLGSPLSAQDCLRQALHVAPTWSILYLEP